MTLSNNQQRLPGDLTGTHCHKSGSGPPSTFRPGTGGSNLRSLKMASGRLRTEKSFKDDGSLGLDTEW